MKGYNTQFDSVKELLKSDDANNYLPEPLIKFFTTAEHIPFSSVEQAIAAYKKVKTYKEANNIKTRTYKKATQESITVLLKSNKATRFIPNDIYKVLITREKYATPEIVKSLIHTFKTIKDKNL